MIQREDKVKTITEIEAELKELFPLGYSYKRLLALEILEELQKRMISPFDFLDKMINKDLNVEIYDNKLEDCNCLENRLYENI